MDQQNGNRSLFRILMLLVSVSCPAGAATLGFKPAVSYPVGTSPVAVVVGDFNGDAKIDLAVANAGDPTLGDDGNVSILLGNGDGTFQPAQNLSVGKNPFSIAVADFNGDGCLDIVVANNGIDIHGGWLPGTVSVLLGNGDGTFQGHVDYPTGSGPSSVAVGDFNGDRRLDLAVATHPAKVVSVLLGNGDGTLQPRVDYPIDASSVVIADFNQDGTPDLAVAGLFGGGGIVGILEGNGDGTFQPAVAYDPAGLFGRFLAVGDFNGDSKLDLVITFANFGNGTASGASVVLGNGDGTFAHATTLPTINTECHVGAPLVADFDGDGRTDIAIIGGGRPGGGVCGFIGSGTVLVFAGNGDGTFRAATSFATTNAGNLVAAADLDGDKAPDLVTVNGVFGNSDNTISVLLNTTGADFSISASVPTPGTVSRGQSSTSTVTLAHLNSFDNPVALFCSVQPSQSATCSLNPSSVTFDSNGNATATLTINTASATASLGPLLNSGPLPFLWPVVGFAIVGAGLGSRRSIRQKLVVCISSAVLFGGLIFQSGCGGSGGPGTTTYTITITGTSASTQHSTTVPLIVK
jgi:hypothetical protein